MLISELAKKTGLSPHTIRFYEKSGLIRGTRNPLVKTNNYVQYSEEIAEKLELIRDAKAVGFTLAEIRNLLDAWYNNRFSVAKKLAILDDKIASINDRIRQLKQMKKLVSQFKESIAREEC